MAYLNDLVLDAALAYVIAHGTRLDICDAEPATYAAATSTNSKGNKTGLTVGAAADRTPNGRKVAVPAIADGSVTGTATVAYWALSDPTNSILVATGPLAASQAVTSGNVFTLASFDVGIPDAA